MQRFRCGLVFKAHRLCASLNSRLVSNKEEGEKTSASSGSTPSASCPTPTCSTSNHLFQVFVLYWRSPESGDLWYTSRRLKRRFGPTLSAGGSVYVCRTTPTCSTGAELFIDWVFIDRVSEDRLGKQYIHQLGRQYFTRKVKHRVHRVSRQYFHNPGSQHAPQLASRLDRTASRPSCPRERNGVC